MRVIVGCTIPTPEGRAELRGALDEAQQGFVMDLRRRPPVGKVILGSNSRSVLLDANRPLLTVRAES